jgi:hypothetical protein
MVAVNKIAKAGLFKWAAVIGIVTSGSTFAKDITLAWNPNTEADLAGYNLYVAEAGQAANTITVSTNSATVLGLVEGKTYTIYATAFNTAGLESDPSQQISYTVPVTGLLPDQMDSPLKLSTGNMRITTRGDAGNTYTLQATTNVALGPWLTVATLQPNTNGIMTYTDRSKLPSRFYRTLQAP